MNASDEADEPILKLQQPPPPVIPILWFCGLLVLVFAPVLYNMAVEWATDNNMGHGFFVIPVALYIVWQKRAQLMALPRKPHFSGYLLMALGFVLLVAGTLGADLFVMRIAFLVSLPGLLAALCGRNMVKALLLPLFLLLFMVRIPLFIYSQITFPLQLLASALAESLLVIIGIPVLREGNVLELASQKLSVVEACSGIRSLLSLGFLSVVYGLFFETRQSVRIVLVASTIPIAIAANALRITLTGLVGEWNKEYAEGVYHALEGWVIFVVALGCLILFHTLLSRVLGPGRQSQEARNA